MTRAGIQSGQTTMRGAAREIGLLDVLTGLGGACAGLFAAVEGLGLGGGSSLIAAALAGGLAYACRDIIKALAAILALGWLGFGLWQGAPSRMSGQTAVILSPQVIASPNATTEAAAFALDDQNRKPAFMVKDS